MTDRPPIRINQAGYLPGHPMRATLVHDGAEPVPFTVSGAAGAVVHTGSSEPWPERPEPTSGMAVHVLDFTGLPAGRDYRLHAAGRVGHRFDVRPDLYRPLAADALAFFTAMRSRHPDDAVPAWTGPDAERLYPGWRCAGTFDVSGGWYDAGDFGKYVTSGAIAVWQLLGILELPGPAPDGVVAECRWQLDWLLRMQVRAGDPLAGMAFHRVHGTEWPPLVCRPEDDPTRRVLHRPSTGATLHLAAAAAHAARLLRVPRYLDAARTAYAAAHRHPALLAPDDHALFGGGPYHDDDLADDFYWAAAELWLATGDDAYHPGPVPAGAFDPAGFDFHRVAAPALLDLAAAGDQAARAAVRDAAGRLLEVQARQPWGQPYAPADGWDWGSNGRLLNNLVVLAAAGHREAVAEGMDYLLGRNALGQSYVKGYGTDFSRQHRTRQPPPPGALAGGANSRPAPDFPYDDRLRGLPPQLCYLDEPTSEVTNDVCIRWNAPLAWVAAYLSAG